jgi:RNA polymerase sigma factor (sigma-70 family)
MPIYRAMDRALKRSRGSSTVAELFRVQARRVRSFLRLRLRSEEDAQDAAQDVFLRLWQREREGTLKTDARSYMVTAVYNAAVDVERRRSNHLAGDHVSIEAVDVAGPGAAPEESLFWRSALHSFVNALNELPDVTQQVFALSHIDGLTHVAIAERLEMSVRNVERHMARAIAHCEARLRDYL